MTSRRRIGNFRADRAVPRTVELHVMFAPTASTGSDDDIEIVEEAADCTVP